MEFMHDLKTYTRDFDLMNDYINKMSIGLSRARNIPIEEAMIFVGKEAEKSLDASKEILVRFTHRQENGDRIIRKVHLLDYIKKIEAAGLGMSPTMTTYKRPDQEVSLIVENIAGSMATRKIVKREAQLADQRGDSTLNTIKNGGQNAIKTLINSWSGAALQEHNTFTCRSTHPSLTSFCRISTALATASVEKFLAGKRYYHTPDKVVEDILAVLAKSDMGQVTIAVDFYKLYAPTVDELVTLIRESSDYYWFDLSGFDSIIPLLKSMSAAERAAFAYDGDFYHLYIFNRKFVDNMLTEMTVTENLPTPEKECIKDVDGDEFCLISNLLGDSIAGTSLWDFMDKDKHPVDNEIRAQANRVAANLIGLGKKYSLLIRTFIRVNHFPIDVGAQNHAIRRTVPLGDTDSTVYSTKHINELYYGEALFDRTHEPISDVMVFMVNGVIGHVLGNFSAQLGVVKESRKLLVMKNEFKIPSLQLTQVAKTYHAYVRAQEGLVFSKRKFELKGSRFHAGKSNAKVIEELQKYMDDNLVNLNSGKLINRGELIDIVLRIESEIEESIQTSGDPFFNRMRVKAREEYKDPDGDWSRYTLWDALYADVSRKAPTPGYTGYKIPLSFGEDSKAWLASLSDRQQKAYLRWTEAHGKKPTAVPTFILIPVECYDIHGIPEQLKPHINRKKVLGAITDPHRLNLVSMGIILDAGKEGRLLGDIIEED